LPAGSPRPGRRCQARRFAGSGADLGRRKDRRWARSWSPEQIANRLWVDFPDDGSMRISHEAIYQALYVQGRGALRRELAACLRTGGALGVPRARTRGHGKQFLTPEILIGQPPAEVADRAVPGHWEGDRILGLGTSAIGTLVERTTRFTMLLCLPRMHGHGVQARVHNGPALAGHGARGGPGCHRIFDRDAARAAPPIVDLGSGRGAGPTRPATDRHRPAGVLLRSAQPWQRGTNENPNGLLRQSSPRAPT
jgi:IS30 family transposase